MMLPPAQGQTVSRIQRANSLLRELLTNVESHEEKHYVFNDVFKHVFTSGNVQHLH
jgi:hypothetical protein